jgi:predicted tellurium resistance membrane protein TerC
VIAGAAFLFRRDEHHRWILYLGVAILGKVGGKMIVEDDVVELTFRARERVRNG